VTPFMQNMQKETGGKTPIEKVHKDCADEAKKLKDSASGTAVIHTMLSSSAGEIINYFKKFTSLKDMVTDSEHYPSVAFSNWGAYALYALRQGTGLIVIQTPKGMLIPSVSSPTMDLAGLLD
jgi:hypothetical protein